MCSYIAPKLKTNTMNEIIKNLEKAMLNASDERRSQLINLVHKLKTNK